MSTLKAVAAIMHFGLMASARGSLLRAA